MVCTLCSLRFDLIELFIDDFFDLKTVKRVIIEEGDVLKQLFFIIFTVSCWVIYYIFPRTKTGSSIKLIKLINGFHGH